MATSAVNQMAITDTITEVLLTDIGVENRGHAIIGSDHGSHLLSLIPQCGSNKKKTLTILESSKGRDRTIISEGERPVENETEQVVTMV